MQLIREDVSEEVAFALGLKVRLGQRAGDGNLGMVGEQFGCGRRAGHACLFLIVEGLESSPLAFVL